MKYSFVKELAGLSFGITALLSTLLIACNKNDNETIGGSSTEKELTTYRLIKTDRDQVADATDIFASLLVVPLAEEVSAKIDYINHLYVVGPDQLIITDEISQLLISIDFSGNLLWHIYGRSNDHRYFITYEESAYDKYKQEIVLFDWNKFYAYDLQGQPVSVSPRPEPDAEQFHYIGPEELLYSGQGLRNAHVTDERKQLFHYKNNVFQAAYLDQYPRYPPEASLLSGVPEFSELNGVIHYHSDLYHTAYQLSLPEIRPAFDLVFSGRETTEKIMYDPTILEKTRYIRSNYIPRIKQVAADQNTIVATSIQNNELANIVIDRDANKTLMNAPYLTYNDQLLGALRIYDNGFIADIVPETYHEQWQTPDYKSPNQLSKAWLDKMQEIKESYDGNGKKYLYLLKL